MEHLNQAKTILVLNADFDEDNPDDMPAPILPQIIIPALRL